MHHIPGYRLSFTTMPLLIALSACGGSNTSTPTVMPATPTVYETFTSTAAVTSNLEGRVGTYTFSGRAVNGSYTHDTKATTIEGVTDSDGPDTNGDFVDDINPAYIATILDGQYDEVSAYDYVIPIAFTDGNSGPIGNNRGYIGIPTLAQDMPAQGSAVFEGTAGGNTSYGDWHNVPASLTATFSSSGGTVDFIGTDTANSQTVILQVTGATITDASFAGGTVSGSLDGVTQDVSSAMTPEFNGQFFGYNEDDMTPGDAGAMIITDGPDGGFDLAFTGTTID